MKQTGGTPLVRRVNESAILELIQERGPLSRADVAVAVGLSLPTVSRIVNKLIHDELVLEHNRGDSTGGRRPALLKFNQQGGFIVGVDLTGSEIASALLDLGGTSVSRHRRPLGHGDQAVENVVAAIECSLGEIPSQTLRGIGIGVPGITRSRDGNVVWSARLGWRDLPLKQIVEERFRTSVFIENNANLGALGEHWRGAGRGVDHLVCISIGPGIGAGIIIHGEVYRGAADAAGEIGYLVVDEQHALPTRDGMGSLESAAGDLSIVEEVVAALGRAGQTVLGPWSPESGQPLLPDAVFAAAARGDPVARQTMERAIRHYAVAVANVACLLNPSLIILRGWIERTNVLDLIKEQVQRMVPIMPRIELSALKEDAVIVGAVALTLRLTSDRLAVHTLR